MVSDRFCVGMAAESIQDAQLVVIDADDKVWMYSEAEHNPDGNVPSGIALNGGEKGAIIRVMRSGTIALDNQYLW